MQVLDYWQGSLQVLGSHTSLELFNRVCGMAVGAWCFKLPVRIFKRPQAQLRSRFKRGYWGLLCGAC